VTVPRSSELSGGPLADITARGAVAVETAREPHALRVALGDAAVDAIIVSEPANGTRGSRILPAPLVLAALASTCRTVQVNGQALVMEYGIYRLR